VGLRLAASRSLPATRAAVLIAALVLGVSSADLVRPAGTGEQPVSPALRVAARPTELLGYLPHWELDDAIDGQLRYDLLTTIALFAVPIRTNGSLDLTSRGALIVLGDRGTKVLQHAHASGVRVVITFTSFVAKSNKILFADPVAQARFVHEAATLIADRGFDGANLDVEQIPGSRFGGYADVVRSLTVATRRANPDAEISVATNGGPSGARMAALAIAAGAQRAVLMGYSYRTAGSSPTGAIDPLARSDGGASLTTSMNLYAAAGVPPGQVLLGLPSYGTTWPTVDGSPHAARQPDRTGFGSGTTYVPARPPAGAVNSVPELDSVEQAVRLAWFDPGAGTWYQAWVDTPATLGAKVDAAAGRGLPGIAIWALGYERGVAGWWDSIAERIAGGQTSRP
jgi:spore germination protein YaaH